MAALNGKPWTLFGAALSACGFIICTIAIHHRNGILAFNSDDAYIYTGYVKMAFTPGAGLFSYNVGEHSAGTTGILYYYLLAASYRVLICFISKSPTALILNTWIIGGICFSITGAILSSTIADMCLRLKILNGKIIAAFVLIGLATLCVSENFLWGQFGGMENPLSALIAMSLAVSSLRERPNMLLASALAAGLIGTRPDWGPIAVLIPALSLLQKTTGCNSKTEPGRVGPDFDELSRVVGPKVRRASEDDEPAARPGRHGPAPSTPRPTSRRVSRVLVGYLVFAILLALIFLPLRLSTGQWQPSALGARVELRLVTSPAAFFSSLRITLDTGWGKALAASWLAAILFHRITRMQPAIYLIPLSITLFLLMRAAVGLDNFNVHDRYISYLWPALDLTYVLGAIALLREVAVAAEFKWRFGLCVVAILFASVVVITSTLPAIDEIVQDTKEMLQVHILPSQWMAENLPANTIVAMEPAGALRTYTNFTLVDRTGLTTPHYARFLKSTGKKPEEDFGDFLRANDVQYLFDYPRQLVFAANLSTLFIERTWTPKPTIHSLGTIALIRVGNKR